MKPITESPRQTPVRDTCDVLVCGGGLGGVAAALSGAPVHEGHASKHSLCFRLGNVDVDAFVQYFADHPDEYPAHMDVDWTLDEALAQYRACGTFLFPHGGGIQMQAFQQARASGDLPAQIGIHDTTDACQMHALRQTGIDNRMWLLFADGQELPIFPEPNSIYHEWWDATGNAVWYIDKKGNRGGVGTCKVPIDPVDQLISSTK